MHDRWSFFSSSLPFSAGRREAIRKTLTAELPRLNAALKREKIDAVDPKAKLAAPTLPTAKPH